MAQTSGATDEMPYKVDATIGTGEKLAARILAALLRQNDLRSVAIDTTNLIITDEVYGNATPNIALTRDLIATNLLPMLERKIIPVVTGFIGATKTGKPTTLGRGGSDYTASVLGLCAGADEVWMWTDVDGMMSADPREIPEAQVIAMLSYDEVAELAYFGARILHARMIGPLQKEHIPLRVKNVFKPQQPGTLIQDAVPERSRVLKAVTSIAGVGLTTDGSGSLSPISIVVDKTLFATIHAHAEVMISAQSSTKSFVCFLIPTSAGPDAIHTTRVALEENLRNTPDTQSWTVHPVNIITVISDKFDQRPSITAHILEALSSIRILAIAQGPSHCSLSVVVEPQFADSALEKLHQLIINSD
jgi:aspartate kinase